MDSHKEAKMKKKRLLQKPLEAAPLLSALMLLGAIPTISFATNLHGAGNLDLSRLTEDRLVLDQVNVIVRPAPMTLLLQANGFEIIDRSASVPFSDERVYENSFIRCRFSYFIVNFSDRDVVLSQPYKYNVLSVHLERDDGSSLGMNIELFQHGEFLPAEAETEAFGSSSTTVTYNDYPTFDSREAARNAATDYCDVSGVVQVQWLEGMSYGVWFRGDDGPRNLSDVARLMLFR